MIQALFAAGALAAPKPDKPPPAAAGGYSAPQAPATSGYSAPQAPAASGYSAPQAPAASGYSAPQAPAGGYAAPQAQPSCTLQRVEQPTGRRTLPTSIQKQFMAYIYCTYTNVKKVLLFKA